MIWGSGQFFVCRQRVKGICLFAAQALLFGIELATGYWFNYFAGQIPFDLRRYGGYFTKGIWGLCTLGTVQGVHGDHSSLLLINGIIAALFLLLFAALFVFNIYDAYQMGKFQEEGESDGLAEEYGRSFARRLFPYLSLTPAIVLMLLLSLMPILFSVLTAFTNYNGDHLPPASLFRWVGLQNFINIVKVPVWSKTFFAVFLWTVIWTLAITFVSYFVALLQAQLLGSEYAKGSAVYRAIYILPWAIPGMVSLLVFRNLFNGQFGPVNQLLLNLHWIHSRIPFFTDPLLAKITIILVNVWLQFPPFMVMLIGVLANQDPTLYDAASIDGANHLQVFGRIKLPLLLHATSPLIIMNLAGNFNAFASIYFLTGGGPTNTSYQFAGSTDILISWIYKLTLNQQLYNMAAVMNLLIFAFIAAVSFWNFRRTTAFKEM